MMVVKFSYGHTLKPCQGSRGTNSSLCPQVSVKGSISGVRANPAANGQIPSPLSQQGAGQPGGQEQPQPLEMKMA